MKSQVIESFLGIRNKEGPRSIPANALADCIDCDLSSEGVLTQRAGFQLAKTIPITTAYSTLDRRAYIVSAGFLYEVLPDLSLIEIAPCNAKNFDDFKDTLFSSEGLQVTDDRVVNLKLPIPDFAPQLTASPGSLPAGTYRAVSTFKAASGLESGPSPLAVIELTSPGSISMQTEIAPAGYSFTGYLTECDGTVFYRPDGVQISPMQLNSQSMPDGDLIAFHDSKLWLTVPLADGNTALYWSYAFHYHWWDLEEGYIIVPGYVIAIKSAGEALIIATTEAIYAYNDSLQVLADYGCIPGNPLVKTAEGEVFMWTYHGIAKALPFENLTERKATFPPGSQCSVALMDTNGISRVVVLNDNQGQAWSGR